MAVQKTALRGTAGLAVIIAIALSGMIYLNYTALPPFKADNSSIYTTQPTFRVGQVVPFYLKPDLTKDTTITEFIWDFHDGDYLYTSTIADTEVDHTFLEPGTFTVSALALKGPVSKVFTIPVTILPAAHDLSISSSASNVLEGTNVNFNASDSFSFGSLPNYIWDFGDGQTIVGKSVSHTFNNAGVYNVRLRGFTNDTYIYTAFKQIKVSNKIPVPTITTSSSSYYEDSPIFFQSSVVDTVNDLGSMKYIWSFGDSLFAQGQNVFHRYPNAGVYNVSLYSVDRDGAIGTTSKLITILNLKPTINQLYNNRSFYSQGETITSTAVVNDTPSDMANLNYKWSIPGDGQVNAYPFFDVGNYSIGLNVTDNNGASDSATTSPFQVINVAPYISLLSAYSEYNISFRTWGTLNTMVNITLFQNGPNNNTNNNLNDVYNYNNTYMFTNQTTYNITNQFVNQTSSQYTVFINNLRQPLNEYWDILINSTNNQTYDTYVETTFNFANHPAISVINHCTNLNSTCLASSYRFPIAPIDRGFPVTYNFSYFDPGHDNLSATIDMGGTLFSKNITKSIAGPTSGSTTIVASLPTNVYEGNIRYYITDEHGGQSAHYAFPFTNYALIKPPPNFVNQSSWSYYGYYIEHYASSGAWLVSNQTSVGKQQTYILNTLQQETNVTDYYTWHFGDGVQSLERFPIHSYNQKGVYLIWVVVKDSYYEHVDYMLVNVTAPFPIYEPFVQGLAQSGTELNFTITGLHTTNSTYFVHWDYGDGTSGIGPVTTHAYTTSGNYTVVVTLTDVFNQKDYSDFIEPINNAPPSILPNLPNSYNIIEGDNLLIKPNVTDSPYDSLNLTYDWKLGQNTFNSSWVSITPEQSYNNGTLTITDAEGSSVTQSFTYNVTTDMGLSLFPKYGVYGASNLTVFINGTINPSALIGAGYKSNTYIKYLLYGKTGNIIASGNGTYDPNNFGFSALLNISGLETKEMIKVLMDTVFSPSDLTPANNPSGPYNVDIILMNKTTDQMITKKRTTLDVTFDQDGDMLPDGLEILYSNTFSNETFNIYSQDSNNNSIADPVEHVIGQDHDGDGLPKFYEDILGTSDNNPDTDGDGLTDGWGPMGELTHGTNPLKADTDGDGLNDGQEVAGWQITVITPQGATIKTVHSNPLSNDTDHDGISDYQEYQLKTDPTSNDTDHDGLTDLQEQQIGTNPNNFDTDFDGISEFTEVNTTFNYSYKEVNGTITTGTYKLNPLSNDTDHDGLSDYQEAYIYHTNGASPDTDLDGITDYNETTKYKTDPLNADTDGDGLADGIEVRGFDIPTVHISGGVYGEGGTVLVAPTITNSTVHVTTNPLLPDTDGDGISDGQEVLGNLTSVSNPTLIDSDGDGVPDNLDSQPLISDYQPPQITSNINVFYSVRPSTQVQSSVGYLTTSLSTIWNYMKNAGNIVGDIIGYSFYWTKSCSTWWLFGYHTSCSWSLHTRSWSDVANYAIGRMEDYIHSNLGQVFPSAYNWQVQYTGSINFYNFGMTIQHDWAGVPNGISFNGFAELVVQSFYSVISGIIDPTINIQANIADNNGIKAIYIYQNGNYVKGITGLNTKQYYLNEAFSVLQNGFTLDPTTFFFEIYDLNNNVREFTRTTSTTQFTTGILNQGITILQETASSIINFAHDAWNWALTGISNLGTAAQNAVNQVANFVNNTYNLVVNWVINQFSSFWEGFVRNSLSSLIEQSYGSAKAGFDTISSDYSGIQDKKSTFSALFDGSGIDSISNSITSFSNNLDSTITSLDVSSQIKAVGNVASSIGSALQGSVVAQAINKIGSLATDILNKVVQETIFDYINNNIQIYFKIISNAIVDMITKLELNVTTDGTTNPTGLSLSSMDLTQILNQMQSNLGQISSPLGWLKDFFNKLSPDTFLQLIGIFFDNNLAQGTSLNTILKNLVSPVAAVGYAIYGLMNLIPTGNLFQKSQVSANEFAVSTMKESLNYQPSAVTVAIASLTFAFNFIGTGFKEASIMSNMFDRQKDYDVEIGTDTGFFSPQAGSAIALMINGVGPAALASVGLNYLPNPDQGTLSNLQRYQKIGYIRVGIGFLYMFVLAFQYYKLHIRSRPGLIDDVAITDEQIFFWLNIGLTIWDSVYYKSIVDQYAQSGFDTAIRIIDQVVTNWGIIHDVLILFTNNGLYFKSGRLFTAVQVFRIAWLVAKIGSMTLDLIGALTISGF